MTKSYASPPPEETPNARSSSQPKQSTVPPKIGVYDRPERTGPSIGLIIGAVVLGGLLFLGVVLFLAILLL